jgi:hypothetical protein
VAGGEPPRRKRLWDLTCPAIPAGVDRPSVPINFLRYGCTESLFKQRSEYVFEIPYNVVITQKSQGLLYIQRTIVQNENLIMSEVGKRV